MALGGVFMIDTDGNIGRESEPISDAICGLLFDISAQTGFWTTGAGATLAGTFKDTVVEFNSLDEVKEAGLKAYSGTNDFLFGVPYYHIKHFFDINPQGRLYVAFADCKDDWNVLIDMQKAANGDISQFGVWTEQSLWRETDAEAETYALDIVSDIQAVAHSLANDYYAPAPVVLNANTAKVKTASGASDTVVLSKIPSCLGKNRYVSVFLGQGIDTDVKAMHLAITSATPVGNVGAVLGCLSVANVGECIGHVQPYNLQAYFPDIEMGFGDVTKVEGGYKNTMRYSSLSHRNLDALDTLGYNMLIKYMGLGSNVYFSDDKTCTDGDYNTISRNRVINKSRRGVRMALLPYVNSPIKIDPTNGTLSASQITVFENRVKDVLNAMVSANEIAGIGSVTIPAGQNILKNDVLKIRYTLIPLGKSKRIEVTEGLVISQQ